MTYTMVVFGASGDLTSRKLAPALYQLMLKRRLPEGTRLVGVSRSPLGDDEFRAKLRESCQVAAGKRWDAALWEPFARNVAYQPGDIDSTDDFRRLAEVLERLEQGQPSTRVYYLATAPAHYETAVTQLGKSGLADAASGPRRIVIEKPFGTDLDSAERLNEVVHRVFPEREVYRIDHYLGKETVQNLLVLRFANAIFEPIWNRNYIDHVQITAAEEIAVGRRGEYYDSAGVLRDMFQNHLLQLTAITAMEAPARFEADAVRNEKVKVLDSIRPIDGPHVTRETFRGQYRGYRSEPGVAADSRTATFAAVRFSIDNWRWQGVPFYLRSGKAMSCRTTQIVIGFRKPPHMLFDGHHEANQLVIQIQPAEGIQIHLQTKVPDEGMALRLTDLNFRFDEHYPSEFPDAYERLLLDTLSGDPSLFARADEVEAAWRIIDPIQRAWDASCEPRLFEYEPLTWGPEECLHWMREQRRAWFDVCPVLGGGP